VIGLTLAGAAATTQLSINSIHLLKTC